MLQIEINENSVGWLTYLQQSILRLKWKPSSSQLRLDQESSINTGSSLTSLRKSAKIPLKIRKGARKAAANSLANTIDGALHGDYANWCRLFEFAPIALSSSTQSLIEGTLLTSLGTKLLNFSDKTVHPAPGTHDYHVNVSKLVDLRKEVSNKLLVDDVL